MNLHKQFHNFYLYRLFIEIILIKNS